MVNRFGLGWRQVAACFMLLAANSFIATGYSVLAVPLGQSFHPSRMVLMLTMTVMAAMSGVLAPVLGALMDRLPLRLLMLLGSLLLSVGYLLVSVAGSFDQVLLIFALVIAPANVLMGPVATTVLLSRWFVNRRGRALGLAISGIAMGSVVFPPLLQLLLDGNDWRSALRQFLVILTLVTVPAALLVIETPGERGLHPDGAIEDPVLREPARPGGKASVRAILSSPAFWLGAIIFSVVLSGLKGMVTNLVPLAIDRGIRPRDAAFLISIYGASGFATKMLFAAISDRLNPRALLFGGLGGFAVGMAVLSQAQFGYGVIVAGVVLVGMFGGIMVPLQSLVIPRIFGRDVVGRSMGLLSTVTLVALLSTPPLFGYIFDVTGSYSAIFLTFVALAIAAMLAAARIRLLPAPAASAGIASAIAPAGEPAMWSGRPVS